MRGSLIFGGCVALGLAAFSGSASLPGQNDISGGRPAFEASTATHEARTEPQMAPGVPSVGEIPAQNDIAVRQEPLPTRSSFMATWDRASGVKGYLLDVSTSKLRGGLP
jgi:hypothetical protein